MTNEAVIPVRDGGPVRLEGYLPPDEVHPVDHRDRHTADERAARADRHLGPQGLRQEVRGHTDPAAGETQKKVMELGPGSILVYGGDTDYVLRHAPGTPAR